MAQTDIAITAGAGVASAKVHIDEVDISNATGTQVDIPSGPHILHWWFMGNSGSTLDISLSPHGGINPIVKISDSIASGYAMEAGDKNFVV